MPNAMRRRNAIQARPSFRESTIEDTGLDVYFSALPAGRSSLGRKVYAVVMTWEVVNCG
jgi:hypothetical protein